MESLIDFALLEKYAEVKKLNSKLETIKGILDWNVFLKCFPDTISNRGRPAYDKILMIRCLFLQSWYSISDQELEFQIKDRLSFQQFLEYPETIPDYSTIWRFREELCDGDIIEKIWAELQNQINQKNLKIEKGTIQDARFIQADPGKTNSGQENRGREAQTARSKDGTWTKKNNKSYFGFKLHIKTRRGSKIIEEVAVTTASTFDNKIDLSNENDIIYRDKAYTGTPTNAIGNGSMKRGNLSIWEILRNKRISKKRCQGEHPFGTMNRSFSAGRTKLTTIPRVFVQQIFVCFAYNLHRLKFLLGTQ